MAGLRVMFWFLKWAVILATLVFVIHFWLNRKSYTFSTQSLAAIAKKHIDTDDDYDVKKTFSKIHHELSKKYVGHIVPKSDLQWVFVNAGGWMGSMCLLHASLTEYVLFFGTAIDTAGHSGRYWANITDIVLTGEFRQWQEGDLNVHIYKPGDTVLHTWGEVTAVNFKAGTWMVEYGRGFIPSTLTFALADTIFSTTDFITLFTISKIYLKALVLEAGFTISQIMG